LARHGDSLDASALLPALAVFASVTLAPGQKATAATVVSAHCVKVSTGPAAMAMATSKVAMLILSTTVGLATVVTMATLPARLVGWAMPTLSSSQRSGSFFHGPTA
jgi:hypothetical protein